MNIENLCTHPEDWPCRPSKVNLGRCGTQEVHDAAMGCIDGHYSLNPEGTAETGALEFHDAESHKTGWTGNSEVVQLDDDDEMQRWRFTRPGEIA